MIIAKNLKFLYKISKPQSIPSPLEPSFEWIRKGMVDIGREVSLQIYIYNAIQSQTLKRNILEIIRGIRLSLAYCETQQYIL